jgi:hypothetical protein
MKGCYFAPVRRNFESAQDAVERTIKDTVDIDMQSSVMVRRLHVEGDPKTIFLQFAFDIMIRVDKDVLPMRRLFKGRADNRPEEHRYHGEEEKEFVNTPDFTLAAHDHSYFYYKELPVRSVCASGLYAAAECPLFETVCKMERSENGMMIKHPWTGVLHHGPNLFSHGGPVAMDGAIRASRFPFLERTSVETSSGIIQKGSTFGTEFARFMNAATVDFYHCAHGLSFPQHSGSFITAGRFICN